MDTFTIAARDASTRVVTQRELFSTMASKLEAYWHERHPGVKVHLAGASAFKHFILTAPTRLNLNAGERGAYHSLMASLVARTARPEFHSLLQQARAGV